MATDMNDNESNFRFMYDEVAMASFDGHAVIDAIRESFSADESEMLFNNGIALLQAVWANGGETTDVPLSALLGASIALWAVVGGFESLTPAIVAGYAASLVAVVDRMAGTTLLAMMDAECEDGNGDD